MIAAKVAGDAEHLIAFHVLTSGSCWVEAVDEPEPAVLLQAGEMVIFPSGEANILASAPGMRGQPDLPRYYRPVDEALPFAIDINGDATPTGAGSCAATSPATGARSTRCWSRCRGWSTPRCPAAAGDG